MKYIQTNGLIIKSWCETPEDIVIEQAKNLAQLPFAFKHICLMPDTHSGYGMPIGGVLATKEYIVPNAVGVDIGCGMIAVKTPWTINQINNETLKKIMKEIREEIPVGFNKHKELQNEKLMPNLDENLFIVQKEWKNALFSLGTLGGGNHFIEIQKDFDNSIWIMIHSGSRNLGKKVADFYNKLAINLNKRWRSIVPSIWELAYLPIDSKEGHQYFKEMNYCVSYALENRKLMISRIANIFDSIIKFKKINLTETINIAHNYARYEHHFGQNVLIHRKGATSANTDEIGIIPGSQGTSSYIVKGLGNQESFKSCSHGAGRTMGRKKAIQSLIFIDEVEKLDNKGIIHSIRTQQDLDEAPGSYKNIETVMTEQKDLVEIIYKLEPLGVIKG